MLKASPYYEFRMDRRQFLFGLMYLPVHIIILPQCLPLLLTDMGITDPGIQNLIYYAIGMGFVLTVYLSFLRAEFDPLLDRIGYCLICFLMALGLDYVLSLGINSVVLYLTEGVDNPNDTAVGEIVLQSSGAISAAAVFLAPVVEEVFFRGVIFGGLRRKSRIAAYVVSIAVFALYHVWQYVFITGDWSMLIYVLQYVPVSLALTWAYERSGSLWVSIGFHMMINSMSLAVEKMLAQM